MQLLLHNPDPKKSPQKGPKNDEIQNCPWCPKGCLICCLFLEFNIVQWRDSPPLSLAPRFLGLQGTPGIHLLHGMRQHRFEHRRSGRPAVLWIPVDGGHSQKGIIWDNLFQMKGAPGLQADNQNYRLHYSLCTS